MGQVTIYLDEKAEAEMIVAAKAEGISYSKWVAQAIREKMDGEWPESIVRLAGAWPDLPLVEELRNPGDGN